MEYFTADTYKNWDRIKEPYDKNGKLYTIVKQKCDRCTKGIFVCRVENGQPVPHPAYGGVCLKCGGAGYLTKEVRLYTEKEYDTMNRNKEKAAARKKEQQEQEMKAHYAQKKKEWLDKNGFNQEEETYIALGNTYAIKDELKAAGFIFNGNMRRWVRSFNTGYEETTEKIKAEDVLEFSAWGEGHYFSNAKEIVDNLLNEEDPFAATSQWVGEKGERITINVSLVRTNGFDGYYGYTHVYTFADADGNVYVWFTAKNIDQKVGSPLSLVATIKEHKEYNGVRQTIITRAKIK